MVTFGTNWYFSIYYTRVYSRSSMLIWSKLSPNGVLQKLICFYGQYFLKTNANQLYVTVSDWNSPGLCGFAGLSKGIGRICFVFLWNVGGWVIYYVWCPRSSVCVTWLHSYFHSIEDSKTSWLKIIVRDGRFVRDIRAQLYSNIVFSPSGIVSQIQK